MEVLTDMVLRGGQGLGDLEEDSPQWAEQCQDSFFSVAKFLRAELEICLPCISTTGSPRLSKALWEYVFSSWS